MKIPSPGTPIQVNKIYDNEGPFLGIVCGSWFEGKAFYVRWIVAPKELYFQHGRGDIIIGMPGSDCFKTTGYPEWITSEGEI